MKLQFDANQEYQLDAINAAVGLFKGQPASSGGFTFSVAGGVGGTFISVVANGMNLDEETLLKNLNEVQKANSIEPSAVFDGMNFSIEMETGTGKTYVYLRTIHELHKAYGWKKFIIVVPSLAIKEGAVKNLQITKEHFETIYEKPTMDFYVFDGKKRGLARNFATTNTLQVMVMGIDQFTRAENLFNKESDWGVPAEFIKGTRPVVIVDEPQNMETDIRRQAIANLNPLCTLRYSATHKNLYNQIYRLDPVRAYDLGLVKKIEVDGITEQDNFNQAYIEVRSIRAERHKVTAKLRIDVNTRDGVTKKDVVVKVGDDLYEKSERRDVYKDGFIVEGFEVDDQTISFSGGVTLTAGEKQGGLTDEVMKFQIEGTIKNHFDKEKSLAGKGIKVLTLFFIDRVANYRGYEGDTVIKGKLALWFEELYEKIRKQAKYMGVCDFDVDKAHNGYFSQDRQGVLKDTGGDTAADDDTYTLIMKDKERLLDINEPLRFIFSHSALREGWDNPNVFQICTLNETASTMKKRQEIGRGMRLPVDSQGKRVWDEQINVLTVSANEHYEDFARALQAEIKEECGVDFDGGRIKDKKKKRKITLTKNLQLDDEFKKLWEKIKHRTKYRVDYDTAELIARAARKVSEVRVTKAKLIRTRAGIGITQQAVTAELRSQSGREAAASLAMIPDMLSYIQAKTRLTRDTICRILVESGRVEDVFVNPQQFMDRVCFEINVVLNEMIVAGIKYEKVTGAYWDQMRFDSEELSGYLNDLYEVQKVDKTVYDYVKVESNIEREFAKACEKRDDIKFYFKLPFWFKIDTPLGTYNPDWALVFEGDKRIYFVAETKGTTEIETLPPSERMKIDCGKKHFRQLDGVEFRGPVTSLSNVVTG